MSVDSDKSKRLKAILKVGEEPLVTHKGDSEDSLLKSSSNLGAGNSNQEFVMVAEEDQEPSLVSKDDKYTANDIFAIAEAMDIETDNKDVDTITKEIELISKTNQQSIPTSDVNNNNREWTPVTSNNNNISDDSSVPSLVERCDDSSSGEEFDLLSDDSS